MVKINEQANVKRRSNMEFCKCGSIILNSKCTNEHCPEKNQKRRDWIVGGIPVDFKRPVTYKEAAELSERIKNAEHR